MRMRTNTRSATRMLLQAMPSLRVFICHVCSQDPPQSGHRVVASCYEEFRTLLIENFECLQRGNFVIMEREDGTVICDDEYFQFLRPETELLVFFEKEMPPNAGLYLTAYKVRLIFSLTFAYFVHKSCFIIDTIPVVFYHRYYTY